ncbi:MAG: hypothetical protein FWC41_02150 [Firmicutes bacterium]|nr:hypothetical protein [Bacillota bacterium]
MEKIEYYEELSDEEKKLVNVEDYVRFDPEDIRICIISPKGNVIFEILYGIIGLFDELIVRPLYWKIIDFKSFIRSKFFS